MSTTSRKSRPTPPAESTNPSSTANAVGKSQFEQSARQRQSGLVGEFLHMLMRSKKWWLTPIVLVLLVLGAMVFLGGTAAAPFIYTLF